MNLSLALQLICGTAALPLLYFACKGTQAFFSGRKTRRSGVEARARIVAVRVMNETGRRIPFVKLKVEIFGTAEGVVEAEGFYPHEEAAALQTGSVVWVRCFSPGTAKVIKKPVPKISLPETGLPLYRFPAPRVAV